MLWWLVTSLELFHSRVVQVRYVLFREIFQSIRLRGSCLGALAGSTATGFSGGL